MTNAGLGAVTSYWALQDADEEQRKLPPMRLKPTLLALIVAGLPPDTETEADLASYSQVTVQVNLPAALLIDIVPLPPLPVTEALHGVFRAEAVQEPPLLVLQPFQVTELMLPVTGVPEPPPALVVLPLIVDSVQMTVTKPDVTTEVAPGESCALIAVPLP